MSRANEPASALLAHWDDPAKNGLTIREYAAIAAMQGICGDGIPGRHHVPDQTARDAVAYADAIIAELAKEQK